jgi:hypothetical protein
MRTFRRDDEIAPTILPKQHKYSGVTVRFSATDVSARSVYRAEG